jgi:Clustered mitochondria
MVVYLLVVFSLSRLLSLFTSPLSADIGGQVHALDDASPECASLKLLAKQLNLAPHSVSTTVNSKTADVTLYTPVDMEAHRGTDGRVYLLDFHRLFPPQTPIQAVKCSHLVWLLRPGSFCLRATVLCVVARVLMGA